MPTVNYIIVSDTISWILLSFMVMAHTIISAYIQVFKRPWVMSLHASITRKIAYVRMLTLIQLVMLCCY